MALRRRSVLFAIFGAITLLGACSNLYLPPTIVYEDDDAVWAIKPFPLSRLALSCERAGPPCPTLAAIENPVDPKPFARRFQAGCAGGDLDDCLRLGDLHRIGLVVSQDPARAISLYRRVCAAGRLIGCHREATGVETGELAARPSPLKAAMRYSALCDQGHALSCVHLGRLYYDGRGVEQDGAKAFGLFERAGPAGYRDLVFYYQWGVLVPKDEAKADALYAAWERPEYLRCKTSDDPDACRLLRLYEAHLERRPR